MKRMLVISDLHCGHVAGLTPPRWQIKPKQEKDVGHTKREKFAGLQKESWDWYVRAVSRHGPYDVVVCNGDAIDGSASRSGGTELLTTDRQEQCDMARYAIRKAAGGPKCKIFMTYGTAYHTGQEEDWEALIATDLNAAKIGSHEWIDCGGVVFDFKHHIGGSSIPHGRHTAVARDALWSDLWAARGKAPKSDVLIRSHVHYHQYCGDACLDVTHADLCVLTVDLAGPGPGGLRLRSGHPRGLMYLELYDETQAVVPVAD